MSSLSSVMTKQCANSANYLQCLTERRRLNRKWLADNAKLEEAEMIKGFTKFEAEQWDADTPTNGWRKYNHHNSNIVPMSEWDKITARLERIKYIARTEKLVKYMDAKESDGVESLLKWPTMPELPTSSCQSICTCGINKHT